MPTGSAQVSEICLFPRSRPGPDRPAPRSGPSIEAILQRTRASRLEANNLIEFGGREHLESIQAAEIDLHAREKELVKERSDLAERERVVNETELLLAARERLLDDREAALAHATLDQDTLALRKSLTDTREALTLANNALAEKDKALASLRIEIDSLKDQLEEARSRPEPASSQSPDTHAPPSLDDISDPSLAEQVAFLREREAFIEQSENTLFDKAQALQEWETRLQQQEHDAASRQSG
jgi:chromosome segregation ATPase